MRRDGVFEQADGAAHRPADGDIQSARVARVAQARFYPDGACFNRSGSGGMGSVERRVVPFSHLAIASATYPYPPGASSGRFLVAGYIAPSARRLWSLAVLSTPYISQRSLQVIRFLFFIF